MGKKYEACVKVDLLVTFEDNGKSYLMDQAIEAAEEMLPTGVDHLGMDIREEWVKEVES